MRQVLSGIRVIELGRGVAASYCGKLFADLGADVVKVEPPAGDPLRRRVFPGGPDGGRGGALLHLTTNKRSTVLDASAAGATERLSRLVRGSQLVIESAGEGEPDESGLLGGWGLTWEQLHDEVPALSVVHLSGFGATGPYAGYLWDDLVVQAVSGILLLQGREDQDPLKLPAQLGLCFVGNMAALGALAAVVLAEATGAGSFVDCAATEALATMPTRMTTLLAYQYRGGAPSPKGLTSSSDTLIPTGVYPCADGYMAMMSTPQQLGEMLEVLDNDDLKEAFARPDAFERGETREVMDAALYPWLLARTRAEATAAAQAAGWPLAGVNLPEEVLAASHLHQRQFWVHADDPVVGSVDLPGPPCRYAEGGWALRRLAPSAGQHDAEVGTEAQRPADRPGPGTVDAPISGATAPAPPITEAQRPADRPGPGTVDAPHTAATAPAPPITGAATRAVAVSAGASSGHGAGRLPLEGIRVVDLTTVWAGPYAAMLLADLGAEVIRVENPWVLPPTTKGYQARPVLTNAGFLGSLYASAAPGRPDRPWNRHAMNNCLGRNKLSWSVDTRRAEGLELVMRLAEQADVFLDNFKANGLARIGIHVSELQARNPGLVVVRMPPAGTTGDWSGYTGFGAQFDGLSGLLSLCGHRGSDLTASPATTYMDAASGPAAALATVAALRYRAGTGRGQVVELAQSENVLNHLGDVFVDCELGVAPERFGNRDRWRAPQGLYRCAGDDRWLAVSVGDDRAWRALASVIGQAELAHDPRFVDAESRWAHHDELDRILGAWSAGQDVVEAFHALQRAGVAAGPLLDDDLFVEDPQFRDRRWQVPLESYDVGTHLHPGLPYRGVPQAWRRGSPVLGEDNEYVYQQVLGVSDEELQRYRDEKMLAEDYLDPLGEPY